MKIGAIVACALIALMFAVAGFDKALWWIEQIVGSVVVALAFRFLAESIGRRIRGLLLCIAIGALIWGCFWLLIGSMAVLVTVAKGIWSVLSAHSGSTLG